MTNIAESAIVKMENLLKDVENTDINQAIGTLLQENLLFDNNYFSFFNSNVKLVVDSYKTKESNAKSMIISRLNELRDTLKANVNAPDLVAVSTILDVVLYPLELNVSLNKKTYKSFNINIDFFRDIKNQNALNYYNELFTDMVIVKSFNFNKQNKLNNFVLYKTEHNLTYEYNSKYICKTIIISDGSRMKLGQLKDNAKKKNSKK